MLEKAPLRTPPLDDAQLDFFVPVLNDIPVKDDIILLDVAPYSLSKNPRRGTIEYQLNDATITVDGTSQHGLANVFDYDITIHMISSLNAETVSYTHLTLPTSG